jgi:hypothetical protein
MEFGTLQSEITQNISISDTIDHLMTTTTTTQPTPKPQTQQSSTNIAEAHANPKRTKTADAADEL